MNMLLNWYFLLFFFFVNQSDANLDSHPAWSKLPKKECGKTRAQKRIVGGEEAALGQFPWMARIGYGRGRNSIGFLCGASLISARYLISAAHCFSEEGNYFVRLGEHDFETDVDCEESACAPKPQDIPLSSVYIHENYTEKNHFNDIALVKMKRDAILNEFVQPICMPQGKIQDPMYKHGGQAIVAGWGSKSLDEESSSMVLMYVPLAFSEIQNCVNLYKFSVRTDNSQLCMGKGIGKDSCGGDSEFVRPICMPRSILQNPKFEHTGYALTAGWGAVSDAFAYDSDVLNFASLSYMDIQKCVEVYGKVRTDKSQLCMGAGDGKNSCDGDSGGPLMQPLRLEGHLNYYLIGVVSYGLTKCGITPSLYSNVAFFLEWILDRLE